MSLNKVMLIGRLGNDPEGKQLDSGTFVANLNLATNKVWKDKEGNKRERTEWHRVVSFGKSAESAVAYLKKGSRAYIEGELQTRTWETDGGEKRYSTEINASQIQFLDAKKKEDGNTGRQESFEGPSFDDDDIPF